MHDDWTPGELIRPPAPDTSWHAAAARLAIQLVRERKTTRLLREENAALARRVFIHAGVEAACVAALVIVLLLR